MRSLVTPPPLSDGRYRLGTPLGEGGMAVVWRGFDTALQIPCAVKILNRAFRSNEDLRTRFLNEARTMAQLRHPNIVAVQNLGEEDGAPYIVMEILEGSAAALIDVSGPMPIPVAIEAISATLHALQFAHSRGVIHRDIKPANILFSEDGTFKITDFGIARIREADHSLTRTGVSLGTWGFMAPEQRKNSRHVDHLADIYATGATLFALVSGETPVDLFTADRDETVLSGVPDVLRPVIARATSYRPEDRYADAAEMRAALKAVLDELPAQVVPYSFDITPPPQLIPPEPEDEPEEEALPEEAAEEPEEPAPPVDGGLTGHGLAELLDEEPPTSARRAGPIFLGAAAVVVVLLLIARALWPAPPVEAPPDEVVDVLPDAPEPPVEEPEEVEEPSAAEDTGKTEEEADTAGDTDDAVADDADGAPEAEPRRSTSTSRPRPVTEEPAEADAPVWPPVVPDEVTEATGVGRVSVRGDATVRLRDASGILHEAGKLSAGRYVILATFDGGEEFSAGTFELADGARLTVRCNSVFTSCSVR